MSKKLLFVLAIILFPLAVIWFLIISPELLKLPANFTQKAYMIHPENNRFDIGSQWGGKTIALSSSNIKTLFATGKKSSIQSNLKVQSLIGETLFELNQNYIVDRYTRHNLPGGSDSEGKSSIVFAPNFIQKQINFWPIEMGTPVTLTLTGAKTIQKLSTNHYSITDAIIDDTAGFEFLPLVPEKYKVLSRVSIDYFVEPLTGTIIDYQDVGVSYYADNNNKAIWDIAEWGNKYNDPTISERVLLANSLRQKTLILSLYIPIIILILGISALTAGLVQKDRKPQKLSK